MKDLARAPISAFIITFNEERHIGDCLDSVSFCDEVIVVDSWSSDRTVEIAETKGARVIQRDWPGYTKQKAFGLSQARNEWALNLDADERVSAQLRASILEAVDQSDSSNVKNLPVAYQVNRVVYYLGRWWSRGGWYPEYRVRLFRKAFVTWGGVDPHERPVVQGKIARLKGALEHYTYEDMNAQFNQLHKFAKISSEQLYEKGRRANLINLLINPFIRSFRFYILKLGFREGIAGLIVALAEGYHTFMKYALLWEREKVCKGQFKEAERSSEHGN